MKIAVLLSGGVDSSVALKRLQDAGHQDITAFYLKVWLEDELSSLARCPWEEDLRYAREVCSAAGVPLEAVSLQREYYEKVVAHALSELRAGRTPSPDIFCNERIKFGVFLERIGPSFAKVASGHYVRLERRDDRYLLRRGVDPVKDQSYFLCHLDQRRLARLLFPLGDLRKDEVRRLAASWGLPTALRPDSQGICFLGKIKFRDFVATHLGERPGEIREHETGRLLGEHRGYWFHTIGQRQGLGLSQGPWFVVAKDVERNVVYVAHEDALERYRRRRYEVDEPHWIAGPPAREELEAKIRHAPQLFECRLARGPEGGWVVTLNRPDPGIAPGQYTVFYDGEVCLGGARIR